MPSWIRRTAALSIAGWLSVGIVAGVAVESASLPMATVAWELESVPAGHPRILPGCGGLERLRANAATPDGKAFAGRILFDTAGLLEAPPVKYQPAADTGQLLWTSRNVLYRINTLGVSYLLSDDPRFARRGILEMRTVADFPSWNPAHFLDVAEMTLAVSIGYDWFYPMLTPDEKVFFRDTILEKGLRPSLVKPDMWWVAGSNNWTQVCHAGMLAGALAVADAQRLVRDSFCVR